jgi:outer membrane immunogenic protein
VKKLALLGAVIAALAFGAPAQAADAPIKGPYYKAEPVFNWTGFYVGGHVGYGWGDLNGVDVDGFLGGVQVGANLQFARNWVIGVEADIAATDIGVGGLRQDWLFTARARLGYAWDRTMLYVTAGIAATDTNNVAISGFAGGVYGVGIEHAFAPRWSVKAEWLYVDYGTEILALGGAATLDNHLLRLGVNYRF